MSVFRKQKLQFFFRARPAPAQNDADQNDQEPRDGAQAQEPPQRGIFTMLWVFLSSFFTSLIPQNPAVVDANWKSSNSQMYKTKNPIFHSVFGDRLVQMSMFWCITSILKRIIQILPNSPAFSDVQTSPSATMGMQMFDDIMKNVQKELQEQVHKGKNSPPPTSLHKNIQSRPSMRSDKPWAVELDSSRAKSPSAKSCSWNSVSNPSMLIFSLHSFYRQRSRRRQVLQNPRPSPSRPDPRPV